MADPITTLLTLAARLQALKTSRNPSEAAKLLDWVQKGGVLSLKPGLTVLFSTRSAVDNTWTIERVATEVPPAGWRDVFATALPELRRISATLEADNKACSCHYVPNTAEVFRAFELTPLAAVRVVIIGQDPYHTVTKNGPIANGLAFSVHQGVGIPPSLRNIFIEVAQEIPGFTPPTSGSLDRWAQQGVLLLNMALTTRPGVAGAHTGYWLKFIQHCLRAIATANPRCIYVLWGRAAQQVEAYLPKSSIILKSAHPSPLSAKGFFGNGHFRRINELLAPYPIDWRL